MDAHLEGARLVGAHLERAVLFGAHLEWAVLFGAHLEGANLRDAHLEGADLQDAHLEGANLRGAERLTQAQLDAAHGDAATEISGELARPAHWRSARDGKGTVPGPAPA